MWEERYAAKTCHALLSAVEQLSGSSCVLSAGEVLKLFHIRGVRE